MRDVLVVVDYQNDFVDKRGSLYVKGSETLVPTINELIALHEVVIYTKDWHPVGHCSFASVCGVPEFTELEGEMKWPEHCIQDTWGSNLYPKLVEKDGAARFAYKGQQGEAYSGFEGNLQAEIARALPGLEMSGVRLVICGVATDYCVFFTVRDALKLGFSVIVYKDSISGISGDAIQKLTELIHEYPKAEIMDIVPKH